MESRISDMTNVIRNSLYRSELITTYLLSCFVEKNPITHRKKKVSTQLFNTRLKIWLLKVDRAINSLQSFHQSNNVYTREKLKKNCVSSKCLQSPFSLIRNSFKGAPSQIKLYTTGKTTVPNLPLLDLYCSICIAGHTYRPNIALRQDLHNVFKFVLYIAYKPSHRFIY